MRAVLTPILLLCILALALPAKADFTLRILHSNDIHARYDETTPGGSACGAKDREANKCVGGVARLATKLKELRTPNAIYLDAGDQFQGTLFYTTYKAQPAWEFSNMLKVDAMTLGNHEFDDGPAVLAEFLTNTTFPVLSANSDSTREPRLQGKYKPNQILTVQGQRIGVLGITTIDTPITSSPGPTLTFLGEIETARRQVAELQAQGVNKIIALTHIGYGNDLALAKAVDGIDVIVGGHSHTLLEAGNPRAAGPYPTMVASPSGAPVAIVTAAAYNLYLGQIDVTFDGAGLVTKAEGKPHQLVNTVPMDPEVQAKVVAFAAPLEAVRAKPIGEASVALAGGEAACRFAECNLGNLLADAILASARTYGAQVAITNGGGIRTSIPAGAVTLGQVLEVLPFSNTVAVVTMTGADLRACLEHGVSRAHDPTLSGTGRFPQIAGMRMTWNGANPEGQRLQSLEIRQPDGSYAPVDPAADYVIATNNFMRAGGDGYALMAKGRNAYDYGQNLEDALAEQFKPGPVAPAIEGRIRRVN
jgi:5'-nucleotidase/UDP-sugar diphosphatase